MSEFYLVPLSKNLLELLNETIETNMSSDMAAGEMYDLDAADTRETILELLELDNNDLPLANMEIAYQVINLHKSKRYGDGAKRDINKYSNLASNVLELFL